MHRCSPTAQANNSRCYLDWYFAVRVYSAKKVNVFLQIIVKKKRYVTFSCFSSFYFQPYCNISEIVFSIHSLLSLEIFITCIKCKQLYVFFLDLLIFVEIVWVNFIMNTCNYEQRGKGAVDGHGYGGGWGLFIIVPGARVCQIRSNWSFVINVTISVDWFPHFPLFLNLL